MALTDKSKAFAQAIHDGMSNREAAIHAGYSASSASQKGSALAKDPDVIAHIEKLKKVKEVNPQSAAKTVSIFDVATQTDISNAKHLSDPLVFLESIYTNDQQELKLRVDAAKAALPYVHGKVGDKGKKETKEDAAKAATVGGGRFGTLGSQMTRPS